MTKAISSKLSLRLTQEGENTLTFFRALAPGDWSRRIYSEGSGWTVQEIFMHFVEAEGSILRLIKHILSGGPGVPEDFDLNGYNERKVAALQGTTPEALIEEFRLRRMATISYVSGLPEESFQHQGRHPFLGIATVEDILKLMYRHNKLHQRDIRRQLNNFLPR